MTEAQANFSINLQGNARDVAQADAEALEELRKSILESTDSIRQMSAAQKSLRGSTEEITAARTQLKNLIQAERDKQSASNLELLKRGVTFEKLVATEKAGAIARAKQESEIKKQIAERRKQEHDAAVESKLQWQLVGQYATMAKDAVHAVADAFVDVTRKALSFGVLIVQSANLLRSLRLVREAATGSELGAENLGSQVEALAGKVSLSREEINGLYVSMVRAFSGTFVGGAGIVKLTEAVARANDALEGSGDKLREIIDRSKQYGRISIGAFELQGTGLSRDDVAGALAKRLKVGLADARLALATGRVPIEQGIDAIADAVEARFGKINLQKFSDLNVVAVKFRDALVGLTSNVKLDPLAEPMQRLLSLFGDSTVTGAALKDVVSDFGNAMVTVAVEAAPVFESWVKRVTIGLLKLENLFFETKIAVKEALGPGGLDKLGDGLKQLNAASFQGTLDATLLVAEALAKGVVNAARFLRLMMDLKKILGEGWKDIGANLVDGLTVGLLEGNTKLLKSIGKMATDLKDAFKNALGIHSPSKVFAEFGKQTAKGYELGMGQGAPAVQTAADAMAPSAPGAPGGVPAAAGGGPAAPLVGELHVHFAPGTAESVVAQASSPSFLAQLVHAIEQALQGGGLPTQEPA